MVRYPNGAVETELAMLGEQDPEVLLSPSRIHAWPEPLLKSLDAVPGQFDAQAPHTSGLAALREDSLVLFFSLFIHRTTIAK
jgi:hypothetical protein